jgi:chaperonin GroES
MLKPLGDNVLVEPLENKEEKIGSIYIPESAKEKSSSHMGTVVAMGTDDELEKLIKVGDVIIYEEFGVNEIEYKGKKYVSVARDKILAKIKK